MKALDFSHYGIIRPLFTNLQQNLVVESVLSGITRGRIYVDDHTDPRLAVLWTEMDAVLLAGIPGERNFPTLRHLLLDEMLPDARVRYLPYFTITVDRLAWAEKLPLLLPDHQLVEVSRLAFHLEQPPPDWRALLPPGMTLQSMDAAFFARQDLENLAAAEGWVLSFWRDIAAFEQRGLGFAVLDGQTVASWALSVYAGAGALEFGVETAVSHRGQGLATVAAAACLEACAGRNMVPHWQCDAANIPSLRLAVRLGFAVQHRSTDYRLTFPPI